MVASAGRAVALVAAVTALSVASAGCVVQDRPHQEAFFVVADAGDDLALPVGSTAHFSWDEHHALEAEGGHAPEVEVEFAWHASGQTEALSHGHDAEVTASAPGLTLVALAVTADGATATDAAGVLFVPPDGDTAHRAWVALTGAPRFYEGSGPGLTVHDVEVAGFAGQWAEVDLQGAGGPSRGATIDFSQVDVALGGEVVGSILVAVKRGPGPAVVVHTGPVTFSASNYYEIRIPVASGEPTLGALPRGTTTTNFQSFGDYAAAHGAGHEVKVPVSHSQTLPGIGALAAAASFAVLGLLAPRRRR